MTLGRSLSNLFRKRLFEPFHELYSFLLTAGPTTYVAVAPAFQVFEEFSEDLCLLDVASSETHAVAQAIAL